MIDDVLKWIDANLPASLERLFALLRIDSISTDPAYAASCQKAADWLVEDLRGMGFAASSRPTPGHPIVVGHHEGKGPHVLFYAHYDVQPVDPIGLWDSPPFEPRIVSQPDGRKWIAARGAGDDKGQMMTFVEAVRAWKAVTGGLPVRISMLLEGEEESGSENLKPFLRDNIAELKSDVALVCDTGMWDRKRAAITTSLRGLVAEEVTITAASRDLHSGMYGNAARNPIDVLASVLSALRDGDGRVTLPGFYDGVVGDTGGDQAAMGDARLRPQGISRRRRPVDSRRRARPFGARTGLGAADGRGERHLGRLRPTWLQDRDPVQGVGEGLLSPRR